PRSGQRSLRIVFNAPSALGFDNVSQLVPVEPQARYRLEFWVRTQGLKSASTLVTTVSDSAEPARPLATSSAVPPGTNDWQQVGFEFTTLAKTEAVTVRINRAPCAEDMCPIFGLVWYDNFNLQRIAAADPGAPAGSDEPGGAARAAGIR
ncbi:MAG: hypothetical protein ACRD68_07760, partial [Pyrinomonadaceae bacterium]